MFTNCHNTQNSASYQDVLQLEVSVDNPLFVNEQKSISDLLRPSKYFSRDKDSWLLLELLLGDQRSVSSSFLCTFPLPGSLLWCPLSGERMCHKTLQCEDAPIFWRTEYKIRSIDTKHVVLQNWLCKNCHNLKFLSILSTIHIRDERSTLYILKWRLQTGYKQQDRKVWKERTVTFQTKWPGFPILLHKKLHWTLCY